MTPEIIGWLWFESGASGGLVFCAECGPPEKVPYKKLDPVYEGDAPEDGWVCEFCGKRFGGYEE